MLLLLLVILLIGIPLGGSYYGDGVYRPYGFGLGGIVLVILVVLLVTGGLGRLHI